VTTYGLQLELRLIHSEADQQFLAS
jgi:hypothetical protein